MHNKYGFQICSGRNIKRLLEIIEKRVYEKEHIYKEEIMSSFFNLINTKKKTFGKDKKSQTNGVIILFV